MDTTEKDRIVKARKTVAIGLVFAISVAVCLAYVVLNWRLVEMVDGSMEPTINGLSNNIAGTGGLVLITKDFSVDRLRSNDLVVVKDSPKDSTPTIRRIRYSPGDIIPESPGTESFVVPSNKFWLIADAGRWMDSNMKGFYEAALIQAKVLHVFGKQRSKELNSTRHP